MKSEENHVKSILQEEEEKTLSAIQLGQRLK